MPQDMTSETTLREPSQMAGPAAARYPAESQATTHGLLLVLFIVSLLLPINFSLGGVRMNPSRLFLLACAIPFALKLFGGRVGGFTWVDRCMLGFVTLMVVALIYQHGTKELAYALSQVLEMFGGYMAGRVMIRGLPDYRLFIRIFLLALLVMMPFAIYEMSHFRMPITEFLSKAFAVVAFNPQSRFGLRRPQVVFPHAILFGLFCSIALASVFYIYRKHVFRRIVYMGVVLAMTFMALSSAPMLSAFLQLGLITWGKVTRGAWKLLAGIVVTIFISLQLFTHRGAFVIFVETMTLDPSTGWSRILIWQYGSQNVLAHPLLGIGLNDWVRPYWMDSSVDNFWLLMAMRYGLPCLFFILATFVLHVTLLIRAKNLGEDAMMLRLGYTITLCALIFLLSTVDVWDAVSVFVFFFIGAGAFLYTSDQSDSVVATQTAASPDRPAGPHFSRFPQTTGRGHRQGLQSVPSPSSTRTTLQK